MERNDKDDEFNLFNQISVPDLFDVFPFNNSIEPFEQEDNHFNFYVFTGIDNFYPYEKPKSQNMDGDQLLEKIAKCEENYNNILHKNLISYPNSNDVKEIFTENLESNLNLAQGTLPGLIIFLMQKENCPVTENFLISEIFPKFEDLRKTNGAKYNGDFNKVLKSTLSSSGIFFKTVDGKFYYKEKEAFDYIIKVTEKVLTQKLQKNKKDSKSFSIKSSGTNKNKKNKSFSAEMNYKISKVYNVLDQMLSRCRGSVETKKMNSSFQNTNLNIELLKKIGDHNKLIGIMMCFKYFKSIINKYFKLSSKKKKLESLLDVNKLNEKLDNLSAKMDFLEKTYLNDKEFSNFNDSNISMNNNASCVNEYLQSNSCDSKNLDL